MKAFRRIMLVVLVILAIVTTVRALRVRSHQVPIEPYLKLAIDDAAAIQHLAGAIRFETVSLEGGQLAHPEAFTAFHKYLDQIFPHLHATLARDDVSEFSLLYTWKGSDTSLAPILLLAHQDVVPVDPATESRWTHPPFSGDIADGFVWGRGTLDDKDSLMAVLEATEGLLAAGFQPHRTILLAFGHDEEVQGMKGAKQVAALLRSRGMHAEFSVDECGGIGGVLGVPAPVAFVNINEKGYVSFELSVETPSGHSSVPPRETALSIMVKALDQLQDSSMPVHLNGPLKRMLEYLAADVPFGRRMIFANSWLAGPLLEPLLVAQPGTNAYLRTTILPTIFEAGTKDNVIPGRARAIVNSRIFPGDTFEATRDHIRDAISDARVKIAALDDWSAALPDSPVDGAEFRTIARSVRQVDPDVVVAPGLCTGQTDSRYYVQITPNLYRLVPVRSGRGDQGRVHGIDERIAGKDYASLIQFYAQLMRNGAQ